MKIIAQLYWDRSIFMYILAVTLEVIKYQLLLNVKKCYPYCHKLRQNIISANFTYSKIRSRGVVGGGRKGMGGWMGISLCCLLIWLSGKMRINENQWESMRINGNHYKYSDISKSFGLGPLKRQDLIFYVILIDSQESQQFSVILK